ncbi:hypothetical protein QQS21_011627 [Conoideocrella luteorostrata]|uniref:Signal transduction histidine kinase dimerisation/phosphoacceptor domain-containing protein n=1 Tax=Conoideocrella luteorostrata TaxID=1105319 RepID=A0AAJ0CDU8_9HYPO|nr:hypothetical protein QQS21_011627 [Conoideocrella luteorostrata]
MSYSEVAQTIEIENCNGVGLRLAKSVSEAVTERETFRYDPSILAKSRDNSDGGLFPSSELATAGDSVLTALAQLGTYKTGTERGFISIFDANHQYIVAEAVPSMRISPKLSNDSCSLPLALCGTAIARSQGTRDHVLYLSDNTDTNTDSHDALELPLFVVPNLFYAGVPIRTQSGINIGAYCVMSTTRPDTWDEQSTQHIRDISRAIMEHLEFRRSRFSYRVHERMNKGIGSFIAGRGTLTGWQSEPNGETSLGHTKLERDFNPEQRYDERSARQSKEKDESEPLVIGPPAGTNGAAETNHGSNLSAGRTTMAPEPDSLDLLSRSDASYIVNPPLKSGGPGFSDAPDSENESDDLFSIAANIIREAFEVEGCTFLDVSFGSYGPPSVLSPSAAVGRDDGNDHTSSTSSDEQAQCPPIEGKDELCDPFGLSIKDDTYINGMRVMHTDVGIIPKRFLAKLLRRYPNGKIFNFDADDELQSSDSSEDDLTIEAQPPTHQPPSPKICRHDEGRLIQRAFPAARSVAFIPVWNPKRERWFAGGFIYTLDPPRIFSIEVELSFLQAFARLITTEVLNLQSLRANKAKSNVLGSLSHELRSPLHGVILGTELLNDTDLSVFQGNTAHTIETCCRALLDTIEHLQDYSKVNSFAGKRKKSLKPMPPMLQKRAKSDEFGKKTLSTDASLDSLVEEVAESVFAGFNFQRKSLRQLSKSATSKFADIAAHNRQDYAMAMEQLGTDIDGQGQQGIPFTNVSVHLLIDPTCNWTLHLQPGVIRRIIMNSVGDSLKYTASGSICISLTQEPPASKNSGIKHLIKLTVQDIRKGIGEDYLQHKLLSPFRRKMSSWPVQV